MRRLCRGWAAVLIIGLVASKAAAQLLNDVQKPVEPPAVTLPAPKPPAAAKTVRALASKSSTPTLPSPSQTLRAGIDATSPLLKAPLSRVSPTFAPPARSSTAPLTGIVHPLLSPNLQRVELALNRVSTIGHAPLDTSSLLQWRRHRQQELLRAHPTSLDLDELGRPIVRGRIVLIDADQAQLKTARSAGFSILGDVSDPILAIRVTTLLAPRGLSTQLAMRKLRRHSPLIAADYDHLYEPAGGALAPARARLASPRGASGRPIGMIDGGVASHPALAGRILEQRGFAGPARATGHGTAVASLLVGEHGRFRGAATGASLLVADVYGGSTAAGSATTIARALSWLAGRNPRVINISLVGPPNALMKRAVDAIRGRGIHIVAAVGNDGPAAPPQYPASYPGVLSITGVDRRGMVLAESGTAAHIDFGAPGADMVAAQPARGYVRVRGTSFAAPLAAGRLALVGSVDRLASEAKPGKGRIGRGIVCARCRIDPRTVAAN